MYANPGSEIIIQNVVTLTFKLLFRQTIMEKNIKKNMYKYMTESLCCTAEINTIL